MSDNTVGVRLSHGGRVYNFDSAGFSLALGQQVIVETEQGLALGVVRRVERLNQLSQHPNPDFQLDSLPPCGLPPDGLADDSQPTGDGVNDGQSGQEVTCGARQLAAGLQKVEERSGTALKKVLRMASYDDLRQLECNRALEKKAMLHCRQKIEELGLNMVMVRADCLFDRSKVVIYFTSEERLDFRELVHDLASHLRTRVELRQIGVRQETKMLGGLGSCGRELCCAHILREFAQVGVKMAKEQSLSLNPAKISGLCGRLMCCLAYEFETYRALCKELPKVGKQVKISPELTGKVLRHSPLTGQLTLALSDGRTVTCTLEEMAALEPLENSRRGARMTVPKPVMEPEKAVDAGQEAGAAETAAAKSDEGEKRRRSRRSRGRKKGKKPANVPETEAQGSEK